MSKRVTVIDIGSNSVRMAVYEKTSRFSFHLLHEAKSKVRISENAYKHDGHLQELPMQRTFNALSDFLKISDSYKSKKIFCVATSALRDAPNKSNFIKKVKQKLKLNIRIINGEREAYYGAIACANLLPEQTNAMSIDIGGGSTEFSLIDMKNVSHTISLELGTVRLKELFFDTDAIDKAKTYIDSKLELLNGFSAETLIGIGGTFRAISTAIQSKNSYPLDKLHAYQYSSKELKKFISSILKAKTEDELFELGIDSNRFDVIKPGALILERVLKKIATQNVITSGVGVREGVYLSDLLRNSKHKFPENYNSSVRYLIDSHIDDTNYSNQLNSLSKKLFDLSYKYLGIEQKYRDELSIAAKLYPAGSSVHFYSKNKHSYYLIQTALEYGFTHKEIVLIATLNKYAKKKLPAPCHIKKYEQLLPDTKTLNALSYLLSLSIALITHKPRNIDFKLTFNNGVLKVDSENILYLSKDAVNKLDCNKNFKVEF